MDRDHIFRAMKNSLRLSENPTIKDTMETVKGWDSLSHLTLMMDLEREFNIRFPMDSIPDLNTVESIVKTIEEES